jgi:tellurite resistance protein TerC
MENLQLWIGFIVAVSLLLAIDLGLFQRTTRTPTLRDAALWTLTWVVLALFFAGGVFYRLGHDSGIEFLSGYLIEYSLSIDNVFLFAVIFRYFQVPATHQRRVLYWGILSAVAFRGVMIAAGARIIEHFDWVNYLFGVFLLYSGLRMYRQREEEPNPSNSLLLRLVRQKLRVIDGYDGQRFWTTKDGKRYATLLFLVLILIEITDVLFALDSIPAIFGITKNTFIVFTSNVLAIMGLRSLYFLLAGVMDMFHYLTVGLAAVLGFVGIKLILDQANWYEIPPLPSLLIILTLLTIAIVSSLIRQRRKARQNV